MTAELQYQISTPAFSAGPYTYPAQALTFTMPYGQQSESLQGMTFDGYALGTVTLHDGLYLTIYGADSSNFFPTPGEFGGLQTSFITAPPWISGASATTTAPDFLVGIRMAPGEYDWQFIQGTITETGLNLPEPSGTALMWLGLAVIAVIAWKTK